MRLINWLTCLFIVGLIFSALALQKWYHLNPCPLCIMQRIAFITLAIVFFIFALLPMRTWLVRLQGLLVLLTAAIGLAIAVRQIYLQYLPADQRPSCGPGLDYLFATLPWHQALTLLFQGSGECGVVDWRFLHLSMASWSGLWLLFFCFFGLVLYRLPLKR